ncbi:MAG: 3-dehydroquinate synthase [Candidatus Izemoplasmatales bacterium]|nr:3-dehydroquinate synthase [Candidatus Izemoplasmatales bacterium]
MKITVKSSRFDYNVYIKKDLLDHIENYIDVEKCYVIISDDNIPEKIIKKVTSKVRNCLTIKFPEGEKSKSFEEYIRITNLLINKSINKETTIIALGGGVTGDLVGFVSSTLYRGVPYIQIPTTLLAQIDSSIGGKVAINVGNIKNSVGQIYPPKLVLIDPSTLETLPERHFNNGMAEMIKHGMIHSQELFNYIKNNDVSSNLEKLIYDSIKIKKTYVEVDEYDNQKRHILNFGHTYGHAYEAYYNYEKYLHGEAVALGMMKVVDKDIAEELRKVLQKFSLPITDSATKEELIDYIKRDKKAKTEGIDIVLLENIGNAYIKNIKIEDL